jgi:hypothetical protein
MGEDNYKLFQPTNIIMIKLFVMLLEWMPIMSWQFDVNVPCKGGDNMYMCLLWKGTRLQYFIPNNFLKIPKEDRDGIQQYSKIQMNG